MNQPSIAQQLAEHQANNRLVKIQREAIEPDEYEGFVIAMSASLCLIQYFRDFFCDGFRVYRIDDITRVKSDEVEGFFTRRAIALGYAEAGGTPPPFDLPLESWASCLRTLRSKGLHVGLHEEVEYPNAMQLGELIDVSEDQADLRTYSTLGEWDDDYFVQELDKLTMVQFGDRYIHAFQTFVEESSA